MRTSAGAVAGWTRGAGGRWLYFGGDVLDKLLAFKRVLDGFRIPAR